MGIILKTQQLSISSGFFEFSLNYNAPHALEERPFSAVFPDEILSYSQRKMLWSLPDKFLFELCKTQKLGFLFQISIESPLSFFLGIPNKIRFFIEKNADDNLYRENIEYYLSLEKYSKNWLVIGKIQEKIEIFEEKTGIWLEFEILPLVVGYIELPKFQVSCVKTDMLLMVADLKQEDLEKIEGENRFTIKNSELLVSYVNGNNVLVCSYEKTKADYAVFV